VVILPKHRRKEFLGGRRREIGQILRELCRQREVELLEVKAMPGHIHMLLRIPPRDSVATTLG
jgi:putative transposase